MTTSKVVNEQIPGDPTGTAIGVAFPEAFVAKLIAGLNVVKENMVTLAAKADEIAADLADPKNHLIERKMWLTKIDRKVDKRALEKEKKIKVLDCDKGKIFALTSALMMTGQQGQDIAGAVLETFVRAGIPLRVEGIPEINKSVFIHLFDDP